VICQQFCPAWEANALPTELFPHWCVAGGCKNSNKIANTAGCGDYFVAEGVIFPNNNYLCAAVYKK